MCRYEYICRIFLNFRICSQLLSVARDKKMVTFSEWSRWLRFHQNYMILVINYYTRILKIYYNNSFELITCENVLFNTNVHILLVGSMRLSEKYANFNFTNFISMKVQNYYYKFYEIHTPTSSISSQLSKTSSFTDISIDLIN